MKLKTKNINQIYEDPLSAGAIREKFLSAGSGDIYFFL